VSYTKVVITAEEDCLFSFGLISDKDESKRGSRIQYGAPEYVSLEGGKRECVVGKMDRVGEEFLISITGDKQVDLMNALEVSCELQDA
jgi:hypothetical protein